MLFRNGVSTSFLGDETHSLERSWATSLRCKIMYLRR